MNLSVLKNQPSLILLIAGIFAGSILLLWQASVVPIITHDDGISYLAAMGNQGVYENDNPAGQWVPASQWKELWSKPAFFPFDRIRDDLAHYDIHPPLYFWALHIWSYVNGVDSSTGPLLNIIFHISTAVFIYLICKSLQCTALVAVGVSLLWLLDGRIISVAQETRQYSFLALASTLYLFSLLLFLRQKIPSSLLFVIFTASIGMLIHYHFALLLGVSALYIFIHLFIKRKWDELSIFLLSLAISGIIFFIVHPDFILSFTTQAKQAQAFATENMLPRVLTCINVFISQFLPRAHSDWIKVLTLVVGILGMLILSFGYFVNRGKAEITQKCDVLGNYYWLPLISALFVTVIIWGLYIFQYSPKHAMQSKYLMLISPIYFVVVGQFISLTVSKNRILYLIPVVLFFQFVDCSFYMFNYDKKANIIESNLSETLPSDSPIIIDSIARGFLPRVLWHTEKTTQVYAAKQIELMVKLPVLSTLQSFLFVSSPKYGNSIKGRNFLLKKFYEKGYKLMGRDKEVVAGEVFLLVKETAIGYAHI